MAPVLSTLSNGSKRVSAFSKSAGSSTRNKNRDEGENQDTQGRPSRERRASEREAQRIQDLAEATAAKAAKAFKKAEKERRKQLADAAAIAAANYDAHSDEEPPPSSSDEDEDNVFSNTTVTSRPQVIKTLSRRMSRIPPTTPSQPTWATNMDDGNSHRRASIVRRHSGTSQRRRIDSPPHDTPFHSPSRNIGSKRPYSPDSSDDEGTREPKRQSGTRPKQADYSPEVKEVITIAIQLWRLKIFCENAFPSVQEETTWVRDVWREACTKAQTDQPLRPDISRVITSRTSHTRGEVKTKVKALVPSIFELESGQNPKFIKKMRTRAENLKEGYNFVYKNRSSIPTKRRGLYQGKIIQKCINSIWFANRRDEGICYADYFMPIPFPALALIFAAIENCIDEWITGIYTSTDFAASDYETVYNDHLAALQEFDDRSKHRHILKNICTKLYNVGRCHSGAQPINNLRAPAITTAAIDAAIEEYNNDSTTETEGEEGSHSDSESDTGGQL